MDRLIKISVVPTKHQLLLATGLLTYKSKMKVCQCFKIDLIISGREKMKSKQFLGGELTWFLAFGIYPELYKLLAFRNP